jgi:hypothetical protein
MINLWNQINYFRGLPDSSDFIYLGTYRDYTIDKKLAIKEGKFFPPYYPGIFYEKNNSYRSLEKNVHQNKK